MLNLLAQVISPREFGLDEESYHSIKHLENICEIMDDAELMLQIYWNQISVMDVWDKEVLTVPFSELERIGFSGLFDKINAILNVSEGKNDRA